MIIFPLIVIQDSRMIESAEVLENMTKSKDPTELQDLPNEVKFLNSPFFYFRSVPE